jgi:hypothetical protein
VRSTLFTRSCLNMLTYSFPKVGAKLMASVLARQFRFAQLDMPEYALDSFNRVCR